MTTAVISTWTPDLRYPVLIDDGTPDAAHRIGLFVRGFDAINVVRWTGTSVDITEARVNETIAAAWDAETVDDQSDERGPVGVAVASIDDPAWTAAMVLAASYRIPIAWIDSVGGRPGSVIEPTDVTAIERNMQLAMGELSVAWNGPGNVDAIALCMAAPARVKIEQGHLAITDVLGREASGARYAFCGQIFGTEAQACWSAMCSIFLLPNGTWLFDGYESGFAPPYALGGAVNDMRQLWPDWPVTIDRATYERIRD